MGKLDEVSVAIGRLEKGQKILLERTKNIENHVKEINGSLHNQNSRIEELERHKWTWKKTLAVVAGLSALISSIVSVMSFLV